MKWKDVLLNYYYESKNRLERTSWTAAWKMLTIHIIKSRGNCSLLRPNILSAMLSNQVHQQVCFQTLCIACQKHVSDFRPRWATPSWQLGPSVFQTLTTLCKSRLFIRAHLNYLQIPRLHNDTRSSRRLHVHSVLNYRVSQKAEFLEYLNDYELLEDSPPSLQLFNDLSTLLAILRAGRSGVSIPSRAGHASLPQKRPDKLRGPPSHVYNWYCVLSQG